MGHVFDLLRGYLAHYGYWAVAGVLLLENAGVPLPGETILLAAAFLAYSEHHLRLPWIIVVGICAATLGDNLGYAAGHHGGRPLLERYRQFFHVSSRHLDRGERLFARFGAPTILFARFVFGMRVIAGPLAGVMRMPWREFAVFNAIGAALWVTTICAVGYFSGQHWQTLLIWLKRADIAIAAVVVAIVLFLVWRNRRSKPSGTESATRRD